MIIMKRIVAFSLLISVGIFSGCCGGKPEASIMFPDPALESVMRMELRKPFFMICVWELLKINELNARGMGIKDISGLEYCENLVKLDLRDNAITSISPLRNLKNLVWLDLANNKITDITPIAGLLKLQYLDLSGDDNDIRDWSPLVANVQAGGLGGGDTVTLSPEWTVKEDGSLYDDFKPVYQVLIDHGVNVVFARSTK